VRTSAIVVYAEQRLAPEHPLHTTNLFNGSKTMMARAAQHYYHPGHCYGSVVRRPIGWLGGRCAARPAQAIKIPSAGHDLWHMMI